MRIIFMGTPDFAVASLDALLKNNFNVVAVITASDKPSGRGQQMSQSAVKKYALEHQIPVLQPTNLKDPVFTEELRRLNADVQFVVAFRMLPESVWNMPPLGTYNLHASLLPKYRGAAPINWAVINGDSESGVTTFRLQHQIDTGNILFQEKVTITDQMTAGQLHDLLMEKGAGLLVKTAAAIESSGPGNELAYIHQEDALATHAPKIFRETCRINWANPCRDIYNLIRGMSPYPAAYTILKNGDGPDLNVKIFFAELEETAHNFANGLLSDDSADSVVVYCNGGKLRITELQMEGKRRMRAEEFLRGFEIKPGARFV